MNTLDCDMILECSRTSFVKEENQDQLSFDENAIISMNYLKQFEVYLMADLSFGA